MTHFNSVDDLFEYESSLDFGDYVALESVILREGWFSLPKGQKCRSVTLSHSTLEIDVYPVIYCYVKTQSGWVESSRFIVSKTIDMK